jgi:hypothetical protein
MLNQSAAGPEELARFSSVDNDVIRSFIGSIPSSFSDAVEKISRTQTTIDERVLKNRIMLSDMAARFHGSANTLTHEVANAISSLSDPETLILVSTHQPNLFAYGGVFKKIVLLESIKQVLASAHPPKKVVNLFLIVDHDFMDETWLRLAQLPSVNHSAGILELRLNLHESQRWKLVCNSPLPEKTSLIRWKSEIRAWIKSNTDQGEERKACLEKFMDMWREYEFAYSRARNYADLNSFFMSRIANKNWKYSTVFVRLSELSRTFIDGFRFLLSNHDLYSQALKNAEQLLLRRGIDTGVSSSSHLYAPVWAHCSCGSKAPVRVIANSTKVLLQGLCISCKKEIALDLGPQSQMQLEEVANYISPRAIPIPILFARELQVACYASGTGGLGYLVDFSVVSNRLNVPPPVIVLWSSKDKYLGIGQRKALSLLPNNVEMNKSTIEASRMKHLDLERAIRSLLSKRIVASEKKEVDQDLLAELFRLKQQQRMIRRDISVLEKASNASSISPCFVDYAVNFGIEGVESLWRSHLFENGDLGRPILFSYTVA